jgi:2-polyprenyl-3-methyl-5-hydroxy-6-metoxy-1,4-benzoquinol methylase
VIREEAFGQTDKTSVVDRFGVWLSGRSVRRATGSLGGIDLGDFGCGYHASFVRSVLPAVASATLGDVDLASDLIEHPKVTAIRGDLPGTLERVPSASLDVVLCLSVLEHLAEPDEALSQFHRVLRPGGVCVVNVPTWAGKFFLEISAFRLGLSPPREMDDHKRYYDPRDLWPQLVKAGFPPHAIRCRRHKFGLNTIAVCRNEEAIS